MSELAFPGPGAPCPPGLRLILLEGWTAEPAGSDLLAARGPDDEDGSTSRLRVLTTVVAATGEDADPASRMTATLALPEGAEVEAPFAVEVSGLLFHGVNASWVEGGARRYRAHLMTTLSTDPVAHLLHLVGEVGGPAAGERYDQVREILSSLVVDVDPATGPGEG